MIPLPTARRPSAGGGARRPRRPPRTRPRPSTTPDRQQARALLAQRPLGALVDEHAPARGLRVLEPQLEARLASAPAGGSASRTGSPATARVKRARARSRCRSRRGSRPTSPSRPPAPCCACRPTRGASSTSRSRTRAARPGRATSATGAASGSLARVARVERVHVRQHDQQVGRQQDRDLRREDVVVAEADLVGRGRVVLVDHRHDAPVEQLRERPARVQVLHRAPRCRRTSAAPGPSSRRARASSSA